MAQPTRPHNAPISLSPVAIAVLELVLERPMHPYEMRQLLRERGVANRVKVTVGALYRTVDKLTEQGVLEVVDTHREGNRPERTTYRVTELGRDAFTAAALEILAQPAEDEFPKYPVALAVLHELTPAPALGALRSRLIALDARIALLDSICTSLHKRNLPLLRWIDYTYVLAMARAERDWTSQLVDDLDTARVQWPNETGANHEH